METYWRVKTSRNAPRNYSYSECWTLVHGRWGVWEVIPFSYLLITASELYLHTIIIIYEFSHERARHTTVLSYYVGAVLSRDARCFPRY